MPRTSGTRCTRLAGAKLIGLALSGAGAALRRASSPPIRSVQMVWMSFHNWSLHRRRRSSIGADNFAKAWNDRQFWTSLRLHAEVHAADHADPDDRRLPDRAAGRAEHAAPPVHPRGRLRAGGDRARRVEPALVLAVQLPTTGWSTGCCSTSASSHKPVVWFGVDADTLELGGDRLDRLEGASASACSSSSPRSRRSRSEINEAAMVDGASYWQRVLPHHAAADAADDPAGDAGPRDRLAARLRPVLHHDRRPAAQPDRDLGVLRLSQLVPLPEARLRRGAVADPGGHHPRLHGRADDR